MKKIFVVIILSILCLPIFSMLATVRAGPFDQAPTTAPAIYDEQLGITFSQNFTSLAYNVTAVAQSDSYGYGPDYLLNGLTDKGYWYQIGLSFNWSIASNTDGYWIGFHPTYEVFGLLDNSIFPASGGAGVDIFNGPVNNGDNVLLSMYFSSGNVTMYAYDWNTHASAQETYMAEGATYFQGLMSYSNFIGYFTGLMTEWYHPNPYYSGESYVVYTETDHALSSGWLWADESEPSLPALPYLFSAEQYINFSNPTQLQQFSPNGTVEAADGYLFSTGSLPDNTPPTTTLMIGSPQYTDGAGKKYMMGYTSLTLTAEDNVGGSGVQSSAYRIYNASYNTGWVNNAVSGSIYWPPVLATFYLTGLSDGTYNIDFNSTDNAGNVEPTNTVTVILDNTPPTTSLTIGNPSVVIAGNQYVAAWTPFTLSATDTGSGVNATVYDIYNGTYFSGKLTYTTPFNLTGLATGAYGVDYYSTDQVGNRETVHTQNVILNSKATMISYAKNEIQALIIQVNASPINKMLKNYLVYNILTSASSQNDLALTLVLNGQAATANGALTVGSKMLQGFMSWVMNARNFGMVPPATAAIWLTAAQTIIGDINTAITTP